MLKYKNVRMVWYGDVERLIEQTYGRKLSIIDEYDANQDTIIELSVPGEDFNYTNVTVEEWASIEPPDPTNYRPYSLWASDPGPGLRAMLNDLHTRGLVEAGDYVIHVWW